MLLAILARSPLKKRFLISMGLSWLNKGYNKTCACGRIFVCPCLVCLCVYLCVSLSLTRFTLSMNLAVLCCLRESGERYIYSFTFIHFGTVGNGHKLELDFDKKNCLLIPKSAVQDWLKKLFHKKIKLTVCFRVCVC